MFYKVTGIIELANTGSLPLGEVQGSCESVLITFFSTDQYITLFSHVFLFKKTLFDIYTVDSLTMNS